MNALQNLISSQESVYASGASGDSGASGASGATGQSAPVVEMPDIVGQIQLAIATTKDKKTLKRLKKINLRQVKKLEIEIWNLDLQVIEMKKVVSWLQTLPPTSRPCTSSVIIPDPAFSKYIPCGTKAQKKLFARTLVSNLNKAIKDKSKKSKNKTRELSGMISGKLDKGIVSRIMAQLTGKSSFGADATPAVGMLKGNLAVYGTFAAVAVVVMLLGFFLMKRMRKAKPITAAVGSVFGAVGDTAKFGLNAFGLRI
jgi:hypothetical protein